VSGFPTAPLAITDDVVIPPDELEWRFDPAGGPGGQHANRAATRVELRFDLGSSPSIPADLRRRMLEHFGPRASGGVIAVQVGESRSQWRNRSLARRRLQTLLREALRTPRRRRPTVPGRAARRRRLEAKRRRSEIKRLRRRPEVS
jgi:ribosome-associated protein